MKKITMKDDIERKNYNQLQDERFAESVNKRGLDTQKLQGRHLTNFSFDELNTQSGDRTDMDSILVEL